jgi:hypothetical protein
MADLLSRTTARTTRELSLCSFRYWQRENVKLRERCLQVHTELLYLDFSVNRRL